MTPYQYAAVNVQAPESVHFSVVLKMGSLQANYHRHVTSKKPFVRVGHEIFKAIWRWAKRRHRNKSAKWKRKKYFLSTKRSQWVFYGEGTGKDGKVRRCQLYNAAHKTIKRRVKIKGI